MATSTNKLDTGNSTPIFDPWSERTPLLQQSNQPHPHPTSLVPGLGGGGGSFNGGAYGTSTGLALGPGAGAVVSRERDIDRDSIHSVRSGQHTRDRSDRDPFPGGDGYYEPGDQSTDPIFDWPKFKQRTHYYVPGTAWIPRYSLSQLKGDVLAGLTLACLLIPQSISYATSLAGLNPLAGLFSASIPALVYAIFGSSRQLNVAPEASLSLITGQTITFLLSEVKDPAVYRQEAIAITTIICFQVGFFTFILGLLRLGFVDVVLSRALLRGFVTAVAVVISIEQLIPMLGLSAAEKATKPRPESTFEKFEFLISNLPHVHAFTATVAFTSLGILIAIRYLKAAAIKRWKGASWVQSIPQIFVLVVVSTILSKQFKWNERGVTILGPVSIRSETVKFLEFPLLPKNLRWFKETTSTAVIISLAGYLDSMVSAKQNSARFGYSISSNRELVALGIANIAGSLTPGTLTAYGSITRSKLSADIGCTSQMAAVVCSTLILLATFFLLPLLEFLPKCVLSAIVFMVVISLLGELPHDFKHYLKLRSWPDLALMFLTFILTIVWNIEIGIVVSFVVSLLLVVRRSAKVRMSILGRIPRTDKWKPVNENPEAEEMLPSGILIVRIRDSLDFANTAQLKERLRRLELFGHEKHHPSERPRRQQARTMGFHMQDVDKIDASAVQIFYEVLESYIKTRQITVFLASLRPKVLRKFQKAGIVELVGEDRIYDNLSSAILHIEVENARDARDGAQNTQGNTPAPAQSPPHGGAAVPGLAASEAAV